MEQWFDARSHVDKDSFQTHLKCIPSIINIKSANTRLNFIFWAVPTGRTVRTVRRVAESHGLGRTTRPYRPYDTPAVKP
jgi:hypothetical protein